MDIARERLQRELDGARLAVTALLAVMTDEQVSGVEKALVSVAPMSETSRAALDELRTARVGDGLAGEKAVTSPKKPKAV